MPQPYHNRGKVPLRRRRPLASVQILEPDDVVELRRRDLDDRRVLDRGDPVHRAGPIPERRTRPDHLLVQDGVSDGAELELRPAGLDQPRLVLLAVDLEAEGAPGLDEQHLPAVVVRLRPDQLVAPRLLDLAHVEAPALERVDVGRVEVGHENCSAPVAIVSPAAIRIPWSSIFRSPTLAPGPTTERPRTSQSEPSSARSPTIEPETWVRAPTIAPAPITDDSTEAPSPMSASAPITARLPIRAPEPIRAPFPTKTGGTRRAFGLTSAPAATSV